MQSLQLPAIWTCPNCSHQHAGTVTLLPEHAAAVLTFYHIVPDPPEPDPPAVVRLDNRTGQMRNSGRARSQQVRYRADWRVAVETLLSRSPRMLSDRELARAVGSLTGTEPSAATANRLKHEWQTSRETSREVPA